MEIWITGCTYSYRVVCFVLDFNSMLFLTRRSFETYYVSRWISFGFSSIYSRERLVCVGISSFMFSEDNPSYYFTFYLHSYCTLSA